MKKPLVIRYSETFKRMVVEQIGKGIVNRYQARIQFGIKSDDTIYRWMRNFGVEAPNIIYRDLPVMKISEEESVPEKTPREGLSVEEELKLLRRENAALKEKLAYEQLRREALDTMINLAESEMQISIRKKSGAKQPKP